MLSDSGPASSHTSDEVDQDVDFVFSDSDPDPDAAINQGKFKMWLGSSRYSHLRGERTLVCYVYIIFILLGSDTPIDEDYESSVEEEQCSNDFDLEEVTIAIIAIAIANC